MSGGNEKLPLEKIAEFFGLNERTKYYQGRIQKAEVEFTEKSVALAQQQASVGKHQAKCTKLSDKIDELRYELRKHELERDRSALNAEHLLECTEQLRDDLKLFREEVKKAAVRGKEIATDLASLNAHLTATVQPLSDAIKNQEADRLQRNAKSLLEVAIVERDMDMGAREEGEIDPESDNRRGQKRLRQGEHTCHHFNGQRGCFRQADECFYRHICDICYSEHHGAYFCDR